MRTLLTATAVMLAVAAAGACTSCAGHPAAHEGGPVVMGGGAGTLCMPTKPGSSVTYGMEVLKNTGTDPVQLESVSLVDAQATHVQKAFVVPIDGGSLVGDWGSWPPPRAATTTTGVRWAERKPLAGMMLPQHQRRDYNLVLHAATDKQGMPRFSAVRVVYTADGTRYAEESSTEVLLKRRCR